MPSEKRCSPRRALHGPSFLVRWLPDPLLSFGGDGVHADPKIGIPLYGPRSFGSPGHPSEVHVGYVGETTSVEKIRRFMEDCAPGLPAKDRDNGSIAFPGLGTDVGFRIRLVQADNLIERITVREKAQLLEQRGPAAQFESLVNLYKEKMALLVEKDHPLDYVFVVLSEDLYTKLRVLRPTQGASGLARSLRRSLKAQLMQYRVPTQIIRESTSGYADDEREMQDAATRAWNLFTAMYYKAGGMPWAPMGLEPLTCFVGVSFYRPLDEPDSVRASVAQAFDESGHGLVLRGQKFPWDPGIDKSPHLTAELSHKLIAQVLERYQQECKHTPRRVVIHKSSRFDPEELDGFREALKGVAQHDLLTVGDTGDFRILRAGRYPPLRGTAAAIGNNHILYTTGYLPGLRTYPHAHVPSPLRVVDHYGDSPKELLLGELLTLTKMNWNTANVDGALPITIQFARLVGEILQEVSDDSTPNPKYSYYM